MLVPGLLLLVFLDKLMLVLVDAHIYNKKCVIPLVKLVFYLFIIFFIYRCSNAIFYMKSTHCPLIDGLTLNAPPIHPYLVVPNIQSYQ